MNNKQSVGKLSLIVLSFLLIIFCLFVLIINITLLYKGTSSIEQAQLIEGNNVSEKIATSVQKKVGLPPNKHLKPGEEMGKLIIPKLNIAIPIFHGTSNQELEKGVGHVIGTALFGENNNTVLSGHRDTVFKKLGELERGDELKVENTFCSFTYKVRKVRIVDENDLTVIVPKPRPTLTVSTCYPFTYIGPAKQRYILVADLISSNFKRKKTAELNTVL